MIGMDEHTHEQQKTLKVRRDAKRCMSMRKNNTERCNNRRYKNTDFCKAHTTEHMYAMKILGDDPEYNDAAHEMGTYLNLICASYNEMKEKRIEYLDREYNHCLLGINDSWKEIPIIYWHYCDNMWWDIRTLCKMITSQLNQSEMEKPYPIFPENPFTRKRINVDDLKKLYDKIKLVMDCANDNISERIIDTFGYISNKILPIHITLDTFLRFSQKTLMILRDTETQYDLSTTIVDRFSQTMRYRMINQKDSQGRYRGYWVRKSEKMTKFEQCFDEIVTYTIISNNIRIVLNTQHYRKMFELLENIPTEEYIV